eukprot:scaffold4342_cov68-Cylindrotheca_fusiformis.AAC.1
MVIKHHLPRGSAFVATTRCAQSPTAARSTPPGLYAVWDRSGVQAVINFTIPNSCCKMCQNVDVIWGKIVAETAESRFVRRYADRIDIVGKNSQLVRVAICSGTVEWIAA